MTIWSPLLLNCPRQISEYLCSLKITHEESEQDQIRNNHCILLSTWHFDKTNNWLVYLKTLRRKAVFNPVILFSFQEKAVILLNQISFPREGVFILRLPFTVMEFKACISSIVNPNSLTLGGIQQQLCFENICSSWNRLRHGKPDEMVNSILIPLRMVLLLDADFEEKFKVLNNIINGQIAKYWQSPLMSGMRTDSEQLDLKNEVGVLLHNFFIWHNLSV